MEILTAYFTVTGIAVMGLDYQTIAMDSVVLIGDQKSIIIAIVPKADSLKDDPELVKLRILSNRSDRTLQYRVGALNRADVTIEDHYVIPDTIRVVITPNPLPLKVRNILKL